jgi:hypothetical protein
MLMLVSPVRTLLSQRSDRVDFMTYSPRTSAPPDFRWGSSINLREHGVKASEAAKSGENSYFHHRLIGFIDEPFRALSAGRPCYRARTRL